MPTARKKICNVLVFNCCLVVKRILLEGKTAAFEIWHVAVLQMICNWMLRIGGMKIEK